MNAIVLTGDVAADKLLIGPHWKNPDTVFVLDAAQTLYEYIDSLALADSVLYRLRICKELSGLDVDYLEMAAEDADAAQNMDSVQPRHAETLSQLLALVDPEKISYVTVNGDADADRREAVRARLGEIVQQLVYLQLPLHRIRVRTEQEMKTAESVRVFEKNVGRLLQEAENARRNLEAGKESFSDRQLLAGTLGGLERIARYLRDSTRNEMKIAVAATKKTGKSVIVNSMIEQELAPTSLEQATPNNCVYRRSYDVYTLCSEGGKKQNFGSGPEGAALLRKHLRKTFEEAQKTKGITIPDMEIGYMLDRANTLTSYVITDTPGPDRAGHLGAEETARKAVRGADMAIYAIDYTKHLTEDESKYLRWIVDEFEKNGKYFSLIFDVNKMDARYQDNGQKSVPRSLDFVRNELIKIDPRFRSCILFGTSALTYFDALAAPRLPGCEMLKGENGLEKLSGYLEDMEEAALAEEDTLREAGNSDPTAILNFLDEARGRLKRFHGVKARSLEDLKASSGMPNLLDYVAYVAREKARAEKLNSLIHKIDREYTDIVNLFRFQELADCLAQKRGKMEEIKALLGEFVKAVNQIYDSAMPEVRELYERGELKSDWMQTYGETYPFRWNKVRDAVVGDLERVLDIHALIRETAENVMPAYLADNYRASQRAAGFSRIKKIRGVERTLISAEEIQACYENAMERARNTMPTRLQEKFDIAVHELQANYKRAQEDMEGIFQSRQSRLRETVRAYSQRLHDQDVPFDLEVPVFAFAFPEEHFARFENDRIWGRSATEDVARRLKNYLSGAPLQRDRNLFQHLWNWIKLKGLDGNEIPPIYYDADALVREYKEDLCFSFEADLRRQHYEKAYEDDKARALKLRREYFDAIQAQMDEEERQSRRYAGHVRQILDNTGELEQEAEKLEHKREDLQRIQRKVKGLEELWRRIRPAPAASTETGR